MPGHCYVRGKRENLHALARAGEVLEGVEELHHHLPASYYKLLHHVVTSKSAYADLGGKPLALCHIPPGMSSKWYARWMELDRPPDTYAACTELSIALPDPKPGREKRTREESGCRERDEWKARFLAGVGAKTKAAE